MNKEEEEGGGGLLIIMKKILRKITKEKFKLKYQNQSKEQPWSISQHPPLEFYN